MSKEPQRALWLHLSAVLFGNWRAVLYDETKC